MAKGSGFTRTVQYFRAADLVEAISCLTACRDVLAERQAESESRPRRSYIRRGQYGKTKSEETASTMAAGANE